MLGRDNNGLNTEVVSPTTSDHSHLMIKKCNQHPKMILITLNYFRGECCRREKSTFMLFRVLSVHRTIFWNILRLMKGHRIAGWAGRQLFKLGSSMVGLYGWINAMNGLIHIVDPGHRQDQKLLTNNLAVFSNAIPCLEN